jgi:hypothetical protein
MRFSAEQLKSPKSRHAARTISNSEVYAVFSPVASAPGADPSDESPTDQYRTSLLTPSEYGVVVAGRMVSTSGAMDAPLAPMHFAWCM